MASKCSFPTFNFSFSLPGLPSFEIPSIPTFSFSFGFFCPLD